MAKKKKKNKLLDHVHEGKQGISPSGMVKWMTDEFSSFLLKLVLSLIPNLDQVSSLQHYWFSIIFSNVFYKKPNKVKMEADTNWKVFWRHDQTYIVEKYFYCR